MIVKLNKPGNRIFTVSTFRIKIAQQAIKMVLELMYAGKFLDTSPRFRAYLY